MNNNNNRSRSSSLPPLRQTQVRASTLPSASSPIMEQAGEINNNEMVNRISVLENLIQSLISAPPILGEATITSATSPSSTSLPVPVADTAEPTITPIEKREVNKRNFALTSISVMAIFSQNRITSTCKDSFARISMIRGALSTANLRNMLDGYRVRPVISSANPYGYTERSSMIGTETDHITGVIRPITIMLEEDDVHYFEHDKGRLFMAVTEMFHTDLRYLVPQEIENCDGVGIYVKIMEHLNGQRGRDVDVAKEAFNNYRMNESLTFKQERARFEDVFKTLEYDQRAKIKESEKIQFLLSRLINDRRVGLKDVMIQTRVADMSYDITVDLLVKINAEMSESNQTVKMAGIYNPKANNKSDNKNVTVTTPTKYCYNFNESGQCRFGASCVYSHERDPNHVTREPREKPSNHDTSKTPSKPVDKSNRTPSVGERFKGGYKGKNPKVKFNKANTIDDNASLKTMTVNNERLSSQKPSSSKPFTSWYNLDQKPFEPSDEINNKYTMNMMNTESSADNEHVCDSEDDDDAPEVHITRTSDFSDRAETIKAINVLQLQHSRRTKATPLQDLEAVHNLDPLTQMTFFWRNFTHLKYPENVEYDAPAEQGGLLISVFTGFKWNPRCPRTGNVVEEIRNPTGSLMEIIYRMNEKFMGAIVVHATPNTPESELHAGNFDTSQYTNFRTIGSREGTPGYYKSTMPNLTSFLDILKNIKTESYEPNLESGNIYIAESTVQLMVL